MLDVDGASISMFGIGDRQVTICATGALAAQSESLQFSLGEGPHWQALRTSEPVQCPDLANTRATDWPMFASAARELGVAAVFAFPMIMGAVVVGVVDLYRTLPGGLTLQQAGSARFMARQLAQAAVREAMTVTLDGMSGVGSSMPALRREVHQATGVVVAQLEVSATEAFARLRAHAFASGLPIDKVARDVISGELNFRTSPQ